MPGSRYKSGRNPFVQGFKLLVWALSFSALKGVNAGITPVGDVDCIYEHSFDYSGNGGGSCHAASSNMNIDFAPFNTCVDSQEENRPGGEMTISLSGNRESAWRYFSSAEMRENPHQKIQSPCEDKAPADVTPSSSLRDGF